MRKILVKDIGLDEDEARKPALNREQTMETVRVVYQHDDDGWWAESPDVEGWYAAGESYAEVRQPAVEGTPFALVRETRIEHFVPADERVAASAQLQDVPLRLI